MRRQLEIFIAFTVVTGHLPPHLLEAIGFCKGLLLQMGNTEAQASESVAIILNPLRDRPDVLERILAPVAARASFNNRHAL
jgi:hypothetical protein